MLLAGLLVTRILAVAIDVLARGAGYVNSNGEALKISNFSVP